MKHRPVLLLTLALILALSLTPLARGEGNSCDPETIGILLGSRACRDLTDEPVAQEALDSILACGLRSPSAVNAQPWHFTVVRDRATAEEIIAVNGVVVVISVAPPLEDLDERVTAFDCGLAAQAMYTAAQALGLGSNIYWGPVAHVNEAMRETLAIPNGYQALMVMTIGHVDTDAVSSATSRNDAGDMVTYID